MKKRITWIILVVLGAVVGVILVSGLSEAAMRQDFAEGTPDSILFQVQVMAHWRAMAAQDRALALERVRRVVEAREAEQRARECNMVRQAETRKVNWDHRAWRWYGANCPWGVR
jgi:hypothetical protein